MTDNTRGVSPFLGIGPPIAVSQIQPQDEVTLGLYTGATSWTKFGYRGDLDTADGSALITAANQSWDDVEVLQTAETFTITYTNTSDGVGQDGALTLNFQYIDADGAAATATHTLGATGTDVTSFTGLGINRLSVASSGVTDANGAAITVVSTTTGGYHAYIPAGESVTQQALFHVPVNNMALMKMVFLNINKIVGSSPVVTVKGWVHNRISDTKYEIFRYIMDTAVENSVTLVEPVNFRLNASDIVYFEAATDTNNTTVCNCRFNLNLYDTTEIT